MFVSRHTGQTLDQLGRSKPKYINEVVWVCYLDNCFFDSNHQHQGAINAAFERIIFGCEFLSERKIRAAWVALHDASNKAWDEWLLKSGDKIFEGEQSMVVQGQQNLLCMHIEALACMQFEDISKELTPVQKAEKLVIAISYGKQFQQAMEDGALYKDLVSIEGFRALMKEIIDDLESELFFAKDDAICTVYPRSNTSIEVRMIRYLFNSFFSMFRTKSLKSAIACFIGAVLNKEVTSEDVKNALRNYPVYGIKKSSLWWEEG